MDLFKGFIGDRYPLCVDLPDKQFLRIGATYRLLGNHSLAQVSANEERSDELRREICTRDELLVTIF
jgi:hypothetical protein